MRRNVQARALLVSGVMLLLTACGGGDDTRSLDGGGGQQPRTYGSLRYAPPQRTPPGPYQAVWNLDVNSAFDLLIERLAADIQHNVLAIDASRGLIVAYYSGPVEGHLDCGQLRQRDRRTGWSGSPVQAHELAVAGISEQSRRYVGERRFRLDARTVIRLSPRGRQTHALAESQYVLSNTTIARDRSGEIVGQRSQTLDFVTGRDARFETDVRCVPTGRLELELLALPTEAGQV